MNLFRIRWITATGCVCFALLFLGESFSNLLDVRVDSVELSSESEESEKEKEKEKETELQEVKALAYKSMLEVFYLNQSSGRHIGNRFIPNNIREIETPPPEFIV